jgi:hypothetical protein
MEQWNNFFFSSIASAAATLTGLIFVGVSMSLVRILSIPKMASRALGALILLLNVWVISVLCILPQQDSVFHGIQILVFGIITWIITLILSLAMLKKIDIIYKKYATFNLLFNQVAVIPFIVGGILIITVDVATGIRWVIFAVIASVVKAVIDAWVLLIEIHK